jgi:hypothetical protein
MRKLVLIALLPLFAACATVPVTGRMVAYNHSPSDIIVLVNGVQAGPRISANSSARFDIDVEVPTNTYGATDPLDQYVQISVAVKNLSRGTLSNTTYCSAGAKIVANVEYKVETYGSPPYAQTYEQITCTTTR